jgi:uncharacterized glyoxalase superfamily protein PhnB
VLIATMVVASASPVVFPAPVLGAQAISPTSEDATMIAAARKPRAGTPAVSLKHLAPVLIVDQVEPCVEFWVKRFGFAASNQVPGPDGKLMFASVAKDGVEVMYQSKASVLADSTVSAAELAGRSAVLFITVEKLDAVEKAVAGAPVVKARHKTFYGSVEMYVKEPGGNTVGFAEFP